MKKAISIVLIICLVLSMVSISFAESFNVSSLTDDELLALKEKVNAEIELRNLGASPYGQWYDYGLGQLLPDPRKVFEREIKGYDRITNNDDSWFSENIDDTTANEFNLYVAAARLYGFNVNMSSSGITYDADNADGFHIHVMQLSDVIWVDVTPGETDAKKSSSTEVVTPKETISSSSENSDDNSEMIAHENLAEETKELSSETATDKSEDQNDNNRIATQNADTVTITSADALCDWIEEDVESTISNLTDKWDEIMKRTTNYDEYKLNVGSIQSLYTEIVDAVENICLRMRCYSFYYTALELNSGKGNREIYNDLNDMYDVIYDDSRDDIYDDIYKDLLEDMYDEIYDGILDKAYDNAPYDEWDDFRSEEYSLWDDARSDVYGTWDETFSDIYSYWDEFRSYIYNDENDLAYKAINQFYSELIKDTEKMGSSIETITGIRVDTASIINKTYEPTALDKLYDEALADVENTISVLAEEWADLLSQTTTFDTFVARDDDVEEFYEKIVDTVENLCVRQQQYAVDFATSIMNSDSDTKYRDLRYIYSCLYGRSRRYIYRNVYNGILKDMHKYYYNGVLKNAKNSTSYSNWSEARSDAYGWWSDARSDTYSIWSDTYSEIYSFYSDMRSEVYSKDFGKAQKVIDKLQKKVDRKKK